jgi:hypothetical protein
VRRRDARPRAHRLSLALAVCSALLLAFVVSTTARATGAIGSAGSARPGHASFSLTVSPARIVIPPGPGTLSRTITASNGGTSALDITVVLSGFAQHRDGTIIFGRDGLTDDAAWITTQPDSFHLRPHQRRTVRLRISVPAGAEPGDHPIGVIFLVPSDTSGDNVTLNRGVGAEMLVRAPGHVVRDVSLTTLNAPALSTGGEVPLTLTLSNTGNVHEDYFAPAGQVQATVKNHKPIAFPDFTVLAGVTRQVTTTWSRTPWFCHCTLTATVGNGHGGTTTVTTTVWILPLQQAVGALLIAVGLILFVQWRRKNRARAVAAARHEGYAAAQAASSHSKALD